MVSSLSAFIAELRRRRVFRVAAVYGGVAFVLTEIVSNVFPALHIPDWAESMVVVLIILGFPIAIGLAWAFDITPEGIVRTEGRSTGKPGTSNRTLIAVTILAVAFGIWGRWGGNGAVGEIRSIAVLPLTNLMNDPEQDYFVDGMHEALTAELSKISALRVIGRTSTMSYKANPKPIPEIAAELNVDAVIEGSVLRDGDIVRITVQLVATKPERHLWSNSYDRGLRDILNLHSDVARAIAEQIKATLTPEEIGRLTTTRQVDPEAYTAYLQGHHIMWELLDWTSAVPFFETAIALDPGYAPPYADLAMAYPYPSAGGSETWDPYIDKSRDLIDRAISLDPQLSLAYISQGMIKTFTARWQEAGEAFRTAITLAPSSRLANVEYGWFLLRTGKVDQAVKHMELALQLDPLSSHSHHSLARALYFQRRYDQALRVIAQGLKLDPARQSFRITAAMAYTQLGRYEEAVEMFDSWELVPFQMKGLILAGRGERVQVMRLIEDLKVLEPGETTDNDVYSVMLYAALGELDLAMDQLELVYAIVKQRLQLWSFGIAYLKVEPAYDPLRGHPRFEALLKDIYGE